MGYSMFYSPQTDRQTDRQSEIPKPNACGLPKYRRYCGIKLTGICIALRHSICTPPPTPSWWTGSGTWPVGKFFQKAVKILNLQGMDHKKGCQKLPSIGVRVGGGGWGEGCRWNVSM